MSSSAASVALLKNLPEGYVIFIADEKNNITFQSKSNGTLINNLREHKKLKLDVFIKYSNEHGHLNISKHIIHWFKFNDYSINNSLAIIDSKTSSDVLKIIVNESFNTDSTKSILCSINGIIGCLNTKLKSDGILNKKNFLKYFEEKISDKNRTVKLNKILQHPEYNSFISKKIDELLNVRKISN